MQRTQCGKARRPNWIYFSGSRDTHETGNTVRVLVSKILTLQVLSSYGCNDLRNMGYVKICIFDMSSHSTQ